MCIEGVEAAKEQEFVSSGSCSIIGKFYKRSPCLPMVLSIATIDIEVLLKCLNSFFI